MLQGDFDVVSRVRWLLGCSKWLLMCFQEVMSIPSYHGLFISLSMNDSMSLRASTTNYKTAN